MRDEVAVEAEANREFEERLGGAVLVGGIERWEVHEEVKRLNHKVATALHEAMGIHFDVRLFVPGTLPRSEGKVNSCHAVQPTLAGAVLQKARRFDGRVEKNQKHGQGAHAL